MANASVAKDKAALSVIRSGLLKVSKRGKVINTETGNVIGYRQSDSDYPMVSFSYRGTIYKILTHRLVWLAYRGLIPKGVEINHISGDKSNPALSNLELSTPSQNMQHAYDTGLNIPLRGEEKVNAAFTDAQVARLREKFAKQNLCPYKGADKFGVHPVTFIGMLRGQTYAHVNSGYEDICARKLINLSTKVDIAGIRGLRKQGKSSYEIASITGHSRNTVMKYW